jgi:hypothetical protein
MFALSDTVIIALIGSTQTIIVTAIGVIAGRIKQQANRLEERQADIGNSVNGRMDQLLSATHTAAKVEGRTEVIEELAKLAPDETEVA